MNRILLFHRVYCIHCIHLFDLFAPKTMSPLPYTTISLCPLHSLCIKGYNMCPFPWELKEITSPQDQGMIMWGCWPVCQPAWHTDSIYSINHDRILASLHGAIEWQQNMSEEEESPYKDWRTEYREDWRPRRRKTESVIELSYVVEMTWNIEHIYWSHRTVVLLCWKEKKQNAFSGWSLIIAARGFASCIFGWLLSLASHLFFYFMAPMYINIVTCP